MDFNTQRKIVKALEEKGRNPLLFLPCLIAKAIVIAVFTVGRSVDVALSDEKGNFLGIKRREKKRSNKYAKEMSRLSASVQEATEEYSKKELRQIGRTLPYRPLGMRAMSAVLAFAFAFMILPATDISAEIITGGKLIIEAVEEINADYFAVNPFSKNISEIDLSSNYSTPDTAVKIKGSIFNNLPSLTTVTLGYSENMEVSGNFQSIAPDSAIFVKADNYTDFTDSYSKLSGIDPSSTKVVWDKNSQFSSQIPDDVTGLKVYSGVDGVILTWDAPSVNAPDGYYIYTYDNSGKYTKVTKDIFTFDVTKEDYVRNNDLPFAKAATYKNGTECIAVVKNSTVVGRDLSYAIRAYNTVTSDYDGDGENEITSTIAGKNFNLVSAKASALKAGKPTLTASASNSKVKLTVTMSKGALPTYINVFSTESNDYSLTKTIYPNELDGNGSFTFTDPVDYTGGNVRSYYAIAYYDIFGKNDHTFFEKDDDYDYPEYYTIHSKREDISSSKLSPPTDLFVDLGDSGEYWALKWDAPSDTEGLPITYDLYANGRLIRTGVTKQNEIVSLTEIEKPGVNVTFAVRAACEGLNPSDTVEHTVDVESACVKLIKVGAGNERAEIVFEPFPNTSTYVITYSYTTPEGTVVPNIKTISADDCVRAGKNLSYSLEKLTNDIQYSISIKANNVNCKYSSVVKTVQPSKAPQPPETVSAEPYEKSAQVYWDIAYMDGTDENGNKIPVDGYYLTVKKKSGQVAKGYDHLRVEGETSVFVDNLENDEIYYAYVTSYIIIEGNPEIESITGTVSAEFMPTVTVDNVLNLMAVPAETSIKVSWSAVKDATSYILYKTEPSGVTTEIAMGKSTSYEDKYVYNEKDYTYKVKALREVDGKTYESIISEPKMAKISVYINSAQGVSATGTDGKITLKWDKTDKADGYLIDACTPTGSEWTRIGNVKATVFEHTGLHNGTEFRYRVIPYRVVYGESVTSKIAPVIVYATAGVLFPAPADFTATAGDGQVTLKWSPVNTAEGYQVFVVMSDGRPYLLDTVSKTTAIHTNISNGTSIKYCVRAYKTVSNEIVYGDYSVHQSVRVGTYMNAPTDVTATPGDAQVSIKWKKTDGAEGYVVYCFNHNTSSFDPVGIVTTTNFNHVGLTNGRNYTYMVAGYKVANGKTIYSDYSLAVSATPNGKSKPTTDSNETVSDYRIYIKGTTPYGMSNSNLISAFAEKGAFNGDVDVRFTLDANTVTTIQNALDFYGEGIDSFMVYPMNIALYASGTDTPVTLNPGYYMTLTIPVPDEMLPYAEYISVVHISDLNQLEILPSIHVNVGGVDCVQFTASSFSPYAFVVYLPDTGEDIVAGSFASAGGSVEYQTTAAGPALMCTQLPELYRRRMRNKTFRITRKHR